MVHVALTIAGSDSSGGAGIQADLKTFAAFGVYGASVVTALTAQNTRGVHAIAAVGASFVAAQLDAVLDDLDVGAAKTGMLLSAAIAAGLARGLDLTAAIVAAKRYVTRAIESAPRVGRGGRGLHHLSQGDPLRPTS